MHFSMKRRQVLQAVGLSLALAGVRNAMAASELPDIEAYRNPGCGCCEQWRKLVEEAGFRITMIDDADLSKRREALGVADEFDGCHLAKVAKYILVGHVPVADILRLLDEQPEALGLAVPGMPIGSPGMETGGEAEKYSVFLLQVDGSSLIYSQY
jgi:hypothetical protein